MDVPMHNRVSQPTKVKMTASAVGPLKPPKVVGIYGISGCGKTAIKDLLSQDASLSKKPFVFYEGSVEVLGGLTQQEFNNLDEAAKLARREQAIQKIATECSNYRCGVVTGHFSFPAEADKGPKVIMTEKDKAVYTHILYLQVPPSEIVRRIAHDNVQGTRRRTTRAESVIDDWQKSEIASLKQICEQHHIVFEVINAGTRLSFALVDDFMETLGQLELSDAELDKRNRNRIAKDIREALTCQNYTVDRMLVLDGDKTLAAVDTTHEFWDLHYKNETWRERPDGHANPVDEYLSNWRYSVQSFREVTKSYKNLRQDQFESLCDAVANNVAMYPELRRLLDTVDASPHLGAVVVTSGLRRVWEQVLRKAGVSSKVHVIGWDYDGDYVVSKETKAEVIEHFQAAGLQTWALGDSELDLSMLEQADKAFLVVGEDNKRSHSVDKFLPVLDNNGLPGQQILIPKTVTPRLPPSSMPVVDLDSPDFHTELMQSAELNAKIRHGTDSGASKLLQTPTRDIEVSGHALRQAHHRIGYHLATQYLTDMITTEGYGITNTRGNPDNGHRLFDERKTVIVPLMRGGEPMAFGVSEAFPLAMFVHAKPPGDLKEKHLSKMTTVILVDAVVNTGASIKEFVDHIKAINADVDVVVVAGVVQEGAVRPGGVLHELCLKRGVRVAALRFSKTKYTGKGTTDTGARLFNTTLIE